jgi:hypothetical protein
MKKEEYLQAHRDNPAASRPVKSGSANTTKFVISEKMGHSIDFESKTPEQTAVWDLGFIDGIEKTNPRSMTFNFEYPGKKKATRRPIRTLDFLLITQDMKATIVECTRPKALHY